MSKNSHESKLFQYQERHGNSKRDPGRNSMTKKRKPETICAVIRFKYWL